MSNDDLLQIDPPELQFPFELKKQISCSMQLTNNSDRHVAFKVKTTNPKKYCVRPNTGVVVPHSACDVIVTMQAQKVAPPDMECRDKFLLQSVVVSSGVAAKDITPEMYNKESGNQVEECKLKVSYIPPLRPSSPVKEISEEGSPPPRASVSDNGTVNQSSESNLVKALISKLTDYYFHLRRCWRPEYINSPVGSAIALKISNGDLLHIDPPELQFRFELKKQISCSMHLTNNSDRHVAFKVKTTNPKKYCVRPNTGVVVPHSACDVIVTMQAQKEAPLDMECRDKFLLQSVVFNKESGNQVEECKLKVTWKSKQHHSASVEMGSCYYSTHPGHQYYVCPASLLY